MPAELDHVVFVERDPPDSSRVVRAGRGQERPVGAERQRVGAGALVFVARTSHGDSARDHVSRGSNYLDLVKIAIGQFDLGPAAAMSIIYLLIVLLLSWIFYTVMTSYGAGK